MSDWKWLICYFSFPFFSFVCVWGWGVFVWACETSQLEDFLPPLHFCTIDQQSSNRGQGTYTSPWVIWYRAAHKKRYVTLFYWCSESEWCFILKDYWIFLIFSHYWWMFIIIFWKYLSLHAGHIMSLLSDIKPQKGLGTAAKVQVTLLPTELKNTDL